MGNSDGPGEHGKHGERAPDAPPTGKYPLLRPLQKGGMGSVWYGWHPDLDIPVAIKTLAPELAAREQYVERFLREARAAARINHPSVVRIYDAGSDGGVYFIVMEYVGGGNISDLVKERGTPLPIAQALDVMIEVTSGLAAAVRFGIIHRDIKPANIMLTEEGAAKLADLGLAKEESLGLAKPELTVTSTLMGTPLYMAPEQAIDFKSVDTRADIYSLAASFYFMLAASPPYTGATPMAIMMKHVNDPIPNPREVNPDVPDAMAALIQRCLAKAPAERCQTPQELVHELRQLWPLVHGGDTATISTPLTSPDGNHCSSCGQHVSGDERFCGRCGQPLRRACPECGRNNRRSVRFCPDCGTDSVAFEDAIHVRDRATHMMEEGRWNRAENEFRELPKDLRFPGPKGQELLRELDELHAAATAKAEQCEELADNINDALREHSYTQALELLDAFLQLSPEDQEMSGLRPNVARMKTAEDLYKMYRRFESLIEDRAFAEASSVGAELLAKGQSLGSAVQIQFEAVSSDGTTKRHSLAVILDLVGDRITQLEDVRTEAEGLLQQADEARERGDVPAARNLLEQAESMYPELPGLKDIADAIQDHFEVWSQANELLDQARNSIKSASFDAARRLLEQARGIDDGLSALESVESDLKSTQTKYTREIEKAKEAHASRDLALACAAANFAHKICPDADEAKKLVDTIRQEQIEANTYIEEAFDLLSSAQFGEARRLLTKSTFLWSPMPEQTMLQRRLESTSEAYQEAMQDAEEALKRRQFVRARDACVRALSTCPDSVEAEFLRRRVDDTHTGFANRPGSGGSLIRRHWRLAAICAILAAIAVLVVGVLKGVLGG